MFVSDKKTGRKFTVQFSRTDRDHIKAAEILNQYERFDKARYIVNAILHYEECNERKPAKIDEKYIESIVNRIIRENQASGAKQENVYKSFGEVNFDETMEAFGEDGLNDVANALDMFRKK